MDTIQYDAFTPSKASPYHREITLDFDDLEHKIILKLCKEELKTMFHIPSKQNLVNQQALPMQTDHNRR